jgi:histidine triad (HIT) family protein
MAEKTIFKRIIDREIPAKIVYEDELCLAFEDVHPMAPTHLLIIPKKELRSVDDISQADEALIGHMFSVIKALAKKVGVSNGYRVVTNCGPDSGQEVMHLHFHLLAGRKMTWPPG